MRKKLFFDIYATGHHSEYISHLIDYLEGNEDNNTYYFVVHPQFSDLFPKIAQKAKGVKNIVWIQVTPIEYQKSTQGNLLKKSFLEFKLVSHYAKLYKVDHVFLMYFNIFQFALSFLRPPFTVSGILFLQFYRMDKKGIFNKLKYFRKYATTKMYCLNPRLKTVFVLNDNKTTDYLNNEFKTEVFRMLPDPIPILIPLEDFNIYDFYNISRDRKIFLHIGSLSERKGTNEIIDAINCISEAKQELVTILLIGKANDEVTASKIKKALENKMSKVQLIWSNDFVTNEMMKSLFDQCDVVLIPYKNAEASSGILGHAAAAKKRVIATGKGLLKEIIEENKLGILLNDVNPIEIANKVEETLDNDVFSNDNNPFIKNHSVNKFAELVLKN